MKLNEWLDASGNKINTSSSGSSSSPGTTKTMKERFTSLLYYIKKNKARTVTKTEVSGLNEAGFTYKEYRTHTTGYSYTQLIQVLYNPFNSEWKFVLYHNTNLIDEQDGKGLDNLIRALKSYYTVPSPGTTEYKRITESLNEWVDSNGKKVTFGSSANVVTSPSSYKKRFEKLIKYHIDHASSELESITKKEIEDYRFHLKEHHNDGHQEFDKDIIVEVDKTDLFSIKILIDGEEVVDHRIRSYKDFIKIIEPYMWLPDGGTPEHDDLLVEWVDAQGKKVNLGTSSLSTTKLSNRDKFIEVTDYMKAHPNPHTTKAEVTRIDDSGFTYKELRSIPNANDITLAVNCNHSRFSDAWSCEVYRNQKLIEDTLGHGWADLLRLLNAYFNAPGSKDPIYQKLIEWVDSNGNKINTSSTPVSKSTTKGGYWERFNRLLFYHVNHKSPGVDKIVRTKVSKDGFHYTEHHRAGVSGHDYDVVVKIDPTTESWTFQTSIDGTPYKGGSGNGYLELLKELGKHMKLPAEGSKEYDKLLTESYSSIADDFRVYETLWD